MTTKQYLKDQWIDNKKNHSEHRNWDVTLNDAIWALTVALANLAAFALSFDGVRSFLASSSSDCRTEIIQNDNQIL